MKRLGLILLLLSLTGAAPASADWRWSDPQYKQPKLQLYNCHTKVCKTKAKRVAKLQLKLKIEQYHLRKEREWTRWVKRYIPRCTWYGESGFGPEFSPARYVMPNATGSGAYGKFQFMPGTYFRFAVYKDWSPLDQEIAARHLHGAEGIAPWANC